jgi:hypothetical protein
LLLDRVYLTQRAVTVQRPSACIGGGRSQGAMVKLDTIFAMKGPTFRIFRPLGDLHMICSTIYRSADLVARRSFPSALAPASPTKRDERSCIYARNCTCIYIGKPLGGTGDTRPHEKSFPFMRQGILAARGCRTDHPRHATWVYLCINPPSRSRRRR